MHDAVTKAVIPAAGRGTRMEPFSKVVPKELAPIGSTPALHLVIDEVHEAGIRQLGIVTAREKELLARYVDVARDAGTWPDLEVSWIEQPTPDGLGDAVQRCRDFCAGEPFALLLPDNLPAGKDYRLSEMTKPALDTGCHVLAVLELNQSYSGLYGDCGRIRYRETNGGPLIIDEILDKRRRPLEVGPGEIVRRTCGRYICQPDLFEEMERIRPTVEGEFDEVPVYQSLARQGRVLGVPIPLPLFDIGHAAGMLAASAFFHNRSTQPT